MVKCLERIKQSSLRYEKYISAYVCSFSNAGCVFVFAETSVARVSLYPVRMEMTDESTLRHHAIRKDLNNIDSISLTIVKTTMNRLYVKRWLFLLKNRYYKETTANKQKKKTAEVYEERILGEFNTYNDKSKAARNILDYLHQMDEANRITKTNMEL